MDVNAIMDQINKIKDEFDNLIKNFKGLLNKNYDNNNDNNDNNNNYEENDNEYEENDIEYEENDNEYEENDNHNVKLDHLYKYIISIIKKYLSDLPPHSSNFNDEKFQGSCDNCKNSSKPNAIQFLSDIIELNKKIDSLREWINRDEGEENRSFNQNRFCFQSHIIKILRNCNCKNDELINFVDSYEAYKEYYDYLKLINLRKDIINSVCDIISSLYNHYWNMAQSEKDTFSVTMNEEFKTKFIQYENAILKYKSIHIPSESNNSTIIDNISNILLSFREKCIKGENIKDNIDMLINVLNNKDINSVNEDLDCFPGNKSYQNAKESFESNSKLLG